MSILVDRPRWHWRDQRWGHLVSDSDLDELHAFATELGLRRLAFQGDHYDLPEPLLDRAVAAGAELVDSRVLVRRLRGAGLRSRGPLGWRVVVRWAGGDARPPTLATLTAAGLPEPTAAELAALARRPGALDLIVLRRNGEWGLGWTGSDTPPALPDPPRRWSSRQGAEHHLDWFVPGRETPDR